MATSHARSSHSKSMARCASQTNHGSLLSGVVFSLAFLEVRFFPTLGSN
jgi:hypothetical protein